jgi:DNA helicase HerA-like ATPase
MTMYQDGKLWIARSVNGEKVCIEPDKANRHGLIAGATGTGKTITLKVMAESFSDMGVPVFLADVKGDLGGMIAPGRDTEDMQKRITRFAIENWKYQAYPTRFWDVYGEGGHPIRTTISDMGPLLMARVLGLNETQTGVLNIAFRVADENGLLLLDLKDLKSMLRLISEQSKQLSLEYGNIAPQSVSAIIRGLVALEDQGGDLFFGEPAFEVKDWMQTTYDGRGWINVLHCVKLFQHPALYSTFLLWMLSELYENLPEAGDLSKPKIVFFFDEAHLLFNEAPKALLQKIELIVRLVRSKGVGVYFITQSPTDLPGDILAQLGNRVQHALRAYTPAEQKKVKTAAETFRPNPAFKTLDAIMELGTGEALVSFLSPDGSPMAVERSFILPPQSRMGSISEDERANALSQDGIGDRYDVAIDRESAYEILAARAEELQEELEREQEEQQAAKEEAAAQKAAEKEAAAARRAAEKEAAAAQKEAARKKSQTLKKAERITTNAAKSATTSVISSTIRRPTGKNLGVGKRAANSAFNSIVNGVGREISGSIVRGIFGTLIKK